MSTPSDVAARNPVTRQVARAGALTGVGAVVSAVMGFAFTVVAGRSLGTAGAGVVFVITSLFTIATTMLKLGSDTTSVRVAARLVALGRGRDVRSVVRRLGVPVLALTLVTAAVVIALAPEVARAALGRSVSTPGAVAGVVVLALLIPAQTMTVILLALLRGLGDIRTLVLVDQVLKPTLRVVLVGAAALVVPGVLGVTVAWVLPVAAGIVVTVVILRRRLDAAEAVTPSLDPEALDAPDESSSRALWAYTLPRAVAQALEIVSLSIGVTLVGRLAGASEAGLFGAVNRLAVAGMLVWQAVRIVISPNIAALLTSHDVDGVRRLHQTGSGWIAALAWPGYLVLAAASPTVLRLFGDDFGAGSAALTTVAIAMLVPSLVGPAQSLVLMAGWSTLGLLVSVAALVTNLVLIFALVPELGAFGAAIAWGAALVVESALYVAITRARLGIWAVGRPALVSAAVATVTVGLPLGVATLSGAGEYVVVGVAALSLLAHLALLMVLRRHVHLDQFVRALRRRGAPSSEKSPR
ncbi:oligosaccharide flippase family protein [Phycicoccus duodecadis]|uniref:O-antigen/teichoic acid export membrane protein n=1 Tax=Phycicoccus duodecadis TaxID=173053 RepID=A0A2N3YIT0_9MICO|nr:oligosaccharide flippase family protein [Phycicoccus duodecadis]PKW26718.1 O-antigen/teichoic acid export membrane protein [Phycicoccus duodecadis]